MKGIKALTTTELLAWLEQAKIYAAQGQVTDRTPKLAMADPGWFAVHICCVTGETFRAGDTACVFPLMSAIKPFSLLYLLVHLGTETVLKWVGVEPSDKAFNSLDQLIADRGHPRNPMINSGAITLADKLPGKNASDRTQKFCRWLNQSANCQLKLDERMLDSVRLNRSTANQAIANYLGQTQHIENIEVALDTFEQICCLSGQVEDLALLGKILASDSSVLKSQYRQIVNAVMLTCGLYEASSQLAIRIGLPMKSGIGGGLLQ
jgi:glutaminase